jgi:hypothetical protein
MARPGVSTRSATRASASGTTSSRGRVQKATARRRRQQSSPIIENRGTDRNAIQPVSQHDQQFQLQIEDLRNHMATRQAELEARIAQIPSFTTQFTAPSTQFAASSAQFPAPPAQFAALPAQFAALPAQFTAPPAQFAAPPTQSTAPPAQFAASTAQPSAFTARPTTFPTQSSQLVSLEADTEGEQLPTIAHAVSRDHPSLPRPLILAIFRGKFYPKDLCKLRLLHGQEAERSDEIVVINGKMLLKKRTGELKDFGTTPSIWSYGFLNYVSTMNEFFGSSVPGLTTALLAFHTTIMMLADIYPWYGCILNLAIEYHQWITEAEKGPTTVEYWRLPVEWKDRYTQSATKHLGSARVATPAHRLNSSNATPTASTASAQKEICQNWNKGACSWRSCKRRHVCSICGNDHPVTNHPDTRS